jgi:hypothetical protein
VSRECFGRVHPIGLLLRAPMGVDGSMALSIKKGPRIAEAAVKIEIFFRPPLAFWRNRLGTPAFAARIRLRSSVDPRPLAPSGSPDR